MRRAFALPALVVVLLAGSQASPSAPERQTATTSPPAGACASPGRYLAEGRPDPCLTPGVVRTGDPQVIYQVGYARRVRSELTSSQWAARRRQVEQLYGPQRNPGEIDHLLPLEGGGSNDLANLWPGASGQYQAKDRAEKALHAAICWPGVTSAQARPLQARFLAATIPAESLSAANFIGCEYAMGCV